MNQELEAMASIDEALGALSEDQKAIDRVLAWMTSKYATNKAQELPGTATKHLPSTQMDGIAEITDQDNFRLTVRDLKANSTLDAAKRIAHVTIYAHTQLTGQTTLSSRKQLVPILREWRAYDGNTRAALARERGIIRDGDMLSLDAHAKKEAETYIAQIRDTAVAGSWSPTSVSKRKKRAGGK